MDYYKWTDEIRDMMIDNAVSTDWLASVGEDVLTQAYQEGKTSEQTYRDLFGQYDSIPLG